MPSTDDEWVVLRRYDDGMAAQIAVDFLRDHGVPVSLRGNSGATSVLNRFDTVLDVRLVVRQKDLPEAQEALLALESPPPSSRIGEEHPEERHNAGAPRSPAAQIGRSLLALAAALVAGFIVTR